MSVFYTFIVCVFVITCWSLYVKSPDAATRLWNRILMKLYTNSPVDMCGSPVDMCGVAGKRRTIHVHV